MSYTASIKFRSFSFYNANYRKQFMSGRNNPVEFDQPTVAKVYTTRWEEFWRQPSFKKNYSLKQNY